MVSRLSGKKTSQIVTACFQRGGARARAAGVLTSAATGASNQPSMPVRRSVRVTSASPWADRSHHCRSGEESHAASASLVGEPAEHVPLVGAAPRPDPAAAEEAGEPLGHAQARRASRRSSRGRAPGRPAG